MFGFDDFALLFAEAAPELLATEGASATAAELAAQEAAREAALAAAQQAAAQEAAKAGILQVSQLPPNFIGEGQQVAGIGDDFLSFLERNNIGVKGVELNPAGAEYPGEPFGREAGNAFFDKGPVRLEPIESPYTPEDFGYKGINQYTGKPIVEGTSLNPFPGGTENLMSKTAAHAPLDANALDYSSQIGYEQANSPALQDYQRTQLENELAARSAAAPPSNIQQFENPASTTQNVFRGNPAEAGFQPPQVTKGGYFNNGTSGDYTDTMTPLERGIHKAGEYFDSASKWAKENPYPAAGLAYYTAYKTGMLDQPKQEPIASDYRNPYSMAGFRRSSPSPSAYRYTPRYAEGGIAGYARGGRSKAESAMDFYDAMNPQQSSQPLTHGDPGIYYDADPDTRYLDPMEAAMVRMSKLNSRTNVQAPSMAPSRRMGELDFKPVAAARGGIMGYASGGDVPVPDEEFKRLTGRGGFPRPDPTEAEKFNPQNVAIYSSDHPIMSGIGRYLTSPTSTIGILANALAPESTKDANSAWSGINPEAMRRQEAQPARQEANINNLVSQVANEGAPPGPSDSEQAANRTDVGNSGLAQGGGIMGYNLGSYAAGGNPRLLRGPGDGMSDNIPATINNRQPARLADGEYVITADVVSHLGNGSTEAGAKQLDAMMKRVRKGRTGTPKQGKQIDPRKYLPA